MLKRLKLSALGILLASSASAQVGSSPYLNGTANFVKPDLSTCAVYPPAAPNHIWYIDSAVGQTRTAMTTAGISLDPTVTPHQGDSTHPWNSWQGVWGAVTGYTTGLVATLPGSTGPIQPGDAIYLNTGSGNYGDVTITSMVNSDFITISPAPGQNPFIGRVALNNVNKINFEGIKQRSGSNQIIGMHSVGDNSHDIHFDHGEMSSTDAATAATWTQSQWATLTMGGWGSSKSSSGGILTHEDTTSCIYLTSSHIYNVTNGAILFSDRTVVTDNEIDHISIDGIDFGGNNLLIQRNHVHDMVWNGGGTHRDMMQGAYGAIFYTWRNVWIDSNKVIFQEDPNLPFPSTTAYTGCINNTNQEWVNFDVTNNVVDCTYVGGPGISDGIGVTGSNGVVMNNTMAHGVMRTSAANTAGGHQSNLIFKNNLVESFAVQDTGVITDNNFIFGVSSNSFFIVGGSVVGSSTIGTYGTNKIISGTGIFTNYDPTTFHYDFTPASGSPAIGGANTATPLIEFDAAGKSRFGTSDVGAYVH